MDPQDAQIDEIHVRLPHQKADTLRKIAKETDRSLNQLMRDIFNQYLIEHKRSCGKLPLLVTLPLLFFLI